MGCMGEVCVFSFFLCVFVYPSAKFLGFLLVFRKWESLILPFSLSFPFLLRKFKVLGICEGVYIHDFFQGLQRKKCRIITFFLPPSFRESGFETGTGGGGVVSYPLSFTRGWEKGEIW